MALSDYISQRIYDCFRINGVAQNKQGSDDVTIAVSLFDGLGNPISSADGALDVHTAHVHTNGVVRKFHRDTGVLSTLDGAVASGATTMILVSGTGFLVGNTIATHIDVIGAYQSFYVITAISTNTITLDRPVDRAIATGSTIHVTEIDLSSSVGTLSSPVIYRVAPEATAGWHITRLIITMSHTSAGDLGLFGNLTKLTNGVLIRGNNDGAYGNITNWKDNADIKIDFFDLEFDTRSGGGGTYGTSGRGTFTKLGMVIELVGSSTQSLEILVQDDLTALSSFEISAQGHVLD